MPSSDLTVPAPLTWRRDVPQWHSVSDLDWIGITDLPLVAGLPGKLVSRASDGSASQTWIVSVPPGWHGDFAATGTLEVFVLEGDLSIAGFTVGVGGFVGVPARSAQLRVASSAGSVLAVFSNPQLTRKHCYVNGELRVVHSRDLPWVAPGSEGGGVAVKRLRASKGDDDSSPGGFLNLLLFLPGFISPEVEFHNTWEEMLYLAGDFAMVERGNAGPGTIHTNPAGQQHGPFASQFGSLMLHHAIEPYRTDFAHRPGGLATVGAYLDSTPFAKHDLRTEVWGAGQQRS